MKATHVFATGKEASSLAPGIQRRGFPIRNIRTFISCTVNLHRKQRRIKEGPASLVHFQATCSK